MQRPSLASALVPVPAASSDHGGQVLVVEDEITVAQLMADILTDLGYSPEVQHDARLALVSALNHDYALIVCDMKMPGLDGQHLYRALVEAGSPLVSRFLFVTGDVLGSSTQEFLKAYRLPHIAKPFRLEEFTEKVELAFRKAESEASPVEANSTSAHKLAQG